MSTRVRQRAKTTPARSAAPAASSHARVPATRNPPPTARLLSPTPFHSRYFSMALMSDALGTAPMMVSIFLPSLKIITCARKARAGRGAC